MASERERAADARRALGRINLDVVLDGAVIRAATIVRWGYSEALSDEENDERREMGWWVGYLGDVARWLRRDRDDLRAECERLRSTARIPLAGLAEREIAAEARRLESLGYRVEREPGWLVGVANE